MRRVCVTIAAGLLLAPAFLQAGSREKASLSSTQTLSFDPGGVIQLEQSFGNVEIQGWDRSEVEITTIKSTQKTYSEAERAAAEKDLDNIAITAVKQGEDHLKITTEFPSRNLAKRPSRGKPNADLKYVIKAPLKAKVVVHHDIGQVSVVNFLGDIEVTNNVGEIGVRLRDPAAYRVDAKTRIGELSSDVGSSEDENISGRQLRRISEGVHQLYLRVGVGDISIRKIRW